MEKKVNLTLNLCYYGFYLLAVAVALLMWQAINRRWILILDPKSQQGITVQWLVIGYTLLSVAGGLYLFKLMIDKAKKQDDKALQLKAYLNWGIVRIVFIGLGIVIGIAAYYWLGGFRSMIWCAAVSTIGLYFCKPTLRKMEIELSKQEAER